MNELKNALKNKDNYDATKVACDRLKAILGTMDVQINQEDFSKAEADKDTGSYDAEYKDGGDNK